MLINHGFIESFSCKGGSGSPHAPLPTAGPTEKPDQAAQNSTLGHPLSWWPPHSGTSASSLCLLRLIAQPHMNLSAEVTAKCSPRPLFTIWMSSASPASARGGRSHSRLLVLVLCWESRICCSVQMHSVDKRWAFSWLHSCWPSPGCYCLSPLTGIAAGTQANQSQKPEWTTGKCHPSLFLCTQIWPI